MSAQPLPLETPRGDPPPNPDRSTGELRLFIRNVFFLSLVGVAISWWLLEFTDFFPAVGGFFGLAGIFAWIAFLTDLVTKKRKEELQQELEQRLLLQRTTATRALLVLMVCGIWAALHGTLVVIGPGDGTKRVVDIRDGVKTVDTIELAPAQTVKVSLWTPRRNRSLILKTPGLPELPVVVSSFARTKIVVPQSFHAQPVVFVAGLTGDDLASLGTQPSVRAEIRRGNGAWKKYGEIEKSSYGGESVWLGASADTELSPALRERQKLAKEPKAIGADDPLRVGDWIRVCVMNSEGGSVAFGEIRVLDAKKRPFPQELPLSALAEGQAGCLP